MTASVSPTVGQQGDSPEPTLRDLWTRYLKAHIIPNRRNYESDTGRARTALDTVLPSGRALGDLHPSEMKRTTAEDYREVRRGIVSALRKRPVSAGTRNREIRIVSAMLAWAERVELIPRNPWARLMGEREAPDRGTVIEPADFYERYLPAADPRFRLAARLCYETGARRDEVRLLRWPSLVDEALHLHALSTKTRRSRRIPIKPDTWAELMALPRRSEYVFTCQRQAGPGGPGRGGRRRDETAPNSRGWWFKMHRQAVERSGLTAPDGVRFHDLRASFCTLMGSKLRRAEVMAMSGHVTAEVFQKYDRVRETDFGRWREAIAETVTPAKAAPPATSSRSVEEIVAVAVAAALAAARRQPRRGEGRP